MGKLSRELPLLTLMSRLMVFLMPTLLGMGFLVVGLLASVPEVSGASFIFIALTFIAFRKLPRPILIGTFVGICAGIAGGYTAVTLNKTLSDGPKIPLLGAALLGLIAGPILGFIALGPFRLVIRYGYSKGAVSILMLLMGGVGALCGASVFSEWYAETLPGLYGFVVLTGGFGTVAGLMLGVYAAYALDALQAEQR